MAQKSRLTVDMSHDEHMCLKMTCAKMGVSMKDFLMRTAFEKIEKFEDDWLASQARKTLEEISSGKEKAISWSEMKMRLEE